MQYFQLQLKNFNKTPKCWLLILAGCKYICGPAKFHLQPCQTYVWPSKWVIIDNNTRAIHSCSKFTESLLVLLVWDWDRIMTQNTRIIDAKSWWAIVTWLPLLGLPRYLMSYKTTTGKRLMEILEYGIFCRIRTSRSYKQAHGLFLTQTTVTYKAYKINSLKLHLVSVASLKSRTR